MFNFIFEISRIFRLSVCRLFLTAEWCHCMNFRNFPQYHWLYLQNVYTESIYYSPSLLLSHWTNLICIIKHSFNWSICDLLGDSAKPALKVVRGFLLKCKSYCVTHLFKILKWLCLSLTLQQQTLQNMLHWVSFYCYLGSNSYRGNSAYWHWVTHFFNITTFLLANF